MASSTPTSRTLRTDRGDHRRRLDHVLVRHLADLPAVSRSRVQRWIADGRVAVEGQRATRPGMRLGAGWRVTVELPPGVVAGAPGMSAGAAAGPVSEERPVDVLWEDASFLAVNKPPGLLVHPTPGQHRGTLLNALAALARRWPGDDPRPRLVQRLDRDTSGVLLVAKSGAAHAALARALGGPEAVKEYAAVVYGRPDRRKGRLSQAIAPHPDDPRRRRAVTDATAVPRARTAATRWELRATTSGPGQPLSLLACRLETGRNHQIRVHLAAGGWPLVGDPLYGEPRWRGLEAPAVARACREFPRQALHARRLVFRHPDSGELLDLRAPWPPDLEALLAVTGLLDA